MVAVTLKIAPPSANKHRQSRKKVFVMWTASSYIAVLYRFTNTPSAEVSATRTTVFKNDRNFESSSLKLFVGSLKITCPNPLCPFNFLIHKLHFAVRFPRPTLGAKPAPRSVSPRIVRFISVIVIHSKYFNTNMRFGGLVCLSNAGRLCSTPPTTERQGIL